MAEKAAIKVMAVDGSKGSNVSDGSEKHSDSSNGSNEGSGDSEGTSDGSDKRDSMTSNEGSWQKWEGQQ